MNLKSFLNDIDNACFDKNKETLQYFIREFARNLPEKERDTFLKKLISAKNEFSNKVHLVDTEIENDILKEIDSLVKYFSTLDPKTVYIDSEYNEDFDYVYDGLPDEDSFDFSDDGELLDKIERACYVIHQCYEYELFDKGWPLVNTLINLKIPVKGDLPDMHGLNILTISDLTDYEIVSQDDISGVLSEVLPFIYFNFSPENRVKVTMNLLTDRDNCLSLPFNSLKKLKHIDLKELDEFYIQIMAELIKEKDSYSKSSLIKDLIENISDPMVVVSEAKKYLKTYPEIMYKHIMSLVEKTTISSIPEGSDEKENALSSVLSLVLECVPEIPPKFYEKEQITELGILLANKLKRQNDLEKLCVDLFSLNACPLNYLKLRYYSEDFHKYDAIIQNIYENEHKKDKCSEKDLDFCDLQLSGFYDNYSFNGYLLMKILDGRAFEFSRCENKQLTYQNFKGSLLYASLLLGYLVLSKKYCSKRSFEFASSTLSNIFTLYPILAFSGYTYTLKKAELLNDKLTSEVVLKHWQKHTSIQNNYEEELFKQIDKNFNALIESALDSRRPNLYENIINWILILLNLYQINEMKDKKESLLKYLTTKHSTKKVFIQKLKKFGIIK